MRSLPGNPLPTQAGELLALAPVGLGGLADRAAVVAVVVRDAAAVLAADLHHLHQGKGVDGGSGDPFHVRPSVGGYPAGCGVCGLAFGAWPATGKIMPDF